MKLTLLAPLSYWETDGILVKINSRKFQLKKLQIIREKSYWCYPHIE